MTSRPAKVPQPLDAVAQAIQQALTPDLLKPEWRAKQALEGAHPMTGHCYVASEAYWHAAGRSQGFVPQVLSGEGWTHWWLAHPDGRVVDITAEQFPNGVDYEAGKGCGFLTRQPSQRAQKVLDRIGIQVPVVPEVSETPRTARASAASSRRSTRGR